VHSDVNKHVWLRDEETLSLSLTVGIGKDFLFFVGGVTIFLKLFFLIDFFVEEGAGLDLDSDKGSLSVVEAVCGFVAVTAGDAVVLCSVELLVATSSRYGWRVLATNLDAVASPCTIEATDTQLSLGAFTNI
jgi:hypothetical protein